MKFVGSSEESVNVSNNETFSTGATDLESFSVISLHNSFQSLQSLADESDLIGARAEPKKIAEARSTGKVLCSVYISYIMAGGNVFKISFVIFLCIFTQILCTGCDFWISYWYTE